MKNYDPLDGEWHEIKDTIKGR